MVELDVWPSKILFLVPASALKSTVDWLLTLITKLAIFFYIRSCEIRSITCK